MTHQWYSTGASLPPRQPRQLPWLFFETIMNSAWQIWRKKISLFFYRAKKLLKYTVSFLQNWKNEYYSTKQKIFLNILGLPCRFKETNIFIILPSIKELLKYAGSSLQIWRNYCIFIPPSKKTSLNILGVLCRIEEINTFSILTSIKNTHWISWVFFADLKK